MKPHVVEDRIEALPLSCVRFTGKIGALAGRLFERRINSAHARNVVYREAADAFRHRIDDADRVIGIWQGEYWGKWVIGAARTARHTGNSELAEFVRKAAYELISLRDADGCISTYRDTAFFTAAPDETVFRALGRHCDWNWNIWCRKYTLWGLLEAYELAGDAPILDAAERFALQLIDTLESRGIALRLTGTFKGLASCSILKPLLLLYRHTGNGRLLDFAESIVADWERPDGEAPNLLDNALSGRPLHEWYPGAGYWSKAYEMLSCFDGLLEYFRLTGYEKCLAAAEGLYDLLTAHEKNRPGSVGYNDQFQHAGIYLNSATEPCDAIHWMRLCGELFKLTGKPRYMESFEETFLNALLASVYRDGSWGMRTLRSSGCHQLAPEQAKMKYNHCCVDNLPRGFLNAVECALMAEDGALVLNGYIPLEAEFEIGGGNVKLEVSGDYLARGEAAVTVECGKALELKLRIPAWSRTAKVSVDGTVRTETPGYAAVELAPGRHEVKLAFDFRPRLNVFPYPGEPEKLSEWHFRRYFNGQKEMGLGLVSGRRALLSAGPLKLARSKLIGSAPAEWEAPSPFTEGKWECRLAPLDLDGVFAGFEAEFVSDSGAKFRTRICDFASAGNVGSCDPELFSMFF